MKKSSRITNRGVWVGLLIILLWFVNLAIALSLDFSFANPLIYLLFLIQTHLFTGLFITAHDSMHGTVSQSKSLNDFIGKICTFLYAFFPYQNLYKKHHLHHKHVGTEHDPDYNESGFFRWYLKFVLEYITVWQFLGYAISFNILKLFLPTPNLIFFWIIPAILSTFQLFYFGTYLPHKGEHDNEHKSSSQSKNHLWAFVSCYFFGYHYEHHDKPYVPWWQLYRHKE